MTRGEIFVGIVIALVVGAFLVTLTLVLGNNSNQRNEREQVTIQKCLDEGNSPLECRFAVKGNVNT